MMNLRSLVVGTRGSLGGWKGSDPRVASICLDLCKPYMFFRDVAHALETAFVVAIFFAIEKILGICASAEILFPVIESISIFVVNFRACRSVDENPMHSHCSTGRQISDGIKSVPPFLGVPVEFREAFKIFKIDNRDSIFGEGNVAVFRAKGLSNFWSRIARSGHESPAKRFALLNRFITIAGLGLAFSISTFAQQTKIQATVVDPNGVPYAFLTGLASLSCPGNAAPEYNGFSVPRTISITGGDGTGSFSMILYDVNLLTPTGCSYYFAITAQNGITNFIATAVGASGSATPITGAGPVNLSVPINAFAVPLPGSSSTSFDMQSKSVPTNVGAAIGTTNIAGQAPSTGLYVVDAYYFVSTVGVGCSGSTNSMTLTLAWTDPLGNAQTSTSSVVLSISFTGNGTINTYSDGLVNMAVKAGTAITYSTASTLASTGCTTTPAYQIYFRATN